MSRSGYSDDCDGRDLIMWRGAVDQATYGKRGQRLLRDLAEAMDAMPTKELIAGSLERDGEVCALGAVGRARGVDLDALQLDEEADGSNNNQIAKAFNIARALAQEIQYVNDECALPSYDDETPTERWTRVRKWVTENLKEATK